LFEIEVVRVLWWWKLFSNYIRVFVGLSVSLR